MPRLRALILQIRPALAHAYLAALVLCGGSAFPSYAEPPQEASAPVAISQSATGQASTRIGGEDRAPCVAVDIAGTRVGHVNCAAQRLEQAARAAQARAKDDPTLTVPNASSSALTVGTASVQASSQRLGGDLRGATSLPQRHVPAPPVSAIPRRP